MKIIVTSAAQRDLIDAYEWYQTTSPGLGGRFIAAVDTLFDFIRQHPSLSRAVLRDLRRIHTKRFPYAVYYEVRDSGTIRIIAIFHTARDQPSLASRV